MIELLHFHFSLSCIGEGNGNPLQYSCLENPRDGGAWWAAVYGVAQSRKRLKWLSSSSSGWQGLGLGSEGGRCGYNMATREILVMELLWVLTTADTRSCTWDTKCIKTKYIHTQMSSSKMRKIWVGSALVKVAQSSPTLCDPMDYTVHAILQARILEWVAFPFSRGSSRPRNRTRVSCTAGRFFTNWAIREAQDLDCIDANISDITFGRNSYM